jgi:type IV secretory pathway VirB10-like protein
MTELEPPSDDLRALFAQERDISDVERVAIRQKLAVSIAAPPAASATIVSTKLVWIAAAVLAAAASIWWITQRSEPATTPVPPVIIESAPILAPEPRITETSPEPAPPAAEAAVTPEPAAATPAQAELLAKAWQALDNDAAAALGLVELDAKLHARGALSEEREALHIFALVQLGRRDQARLLADKFIALYPSSVHRATIERRLR